MESCEISRTFRRRGGKPGVGPVGNDSINPVYVIKPSGHGALVIFPGRQYYEYRHMWLFRGQCVPTFGTHTVFTLCNYFKF